MAPLPAKAVAVEEGATATEENLGTGKDSTVVLAKPSASEQLPAQSLLPEELEEAMDETDLAARPKRQREEESAPSSSQKRAAETPLEDLANASEAEKERMIAAIASGRDELHEAEEFALEGDVDDLAFGAGSGDFRTRSRGAEVGQA
eukprot:1039879-Amphidinium_carterae.1